MGDKPAELPSRFLAFLPQVWYHISMLKTGGIAMFCADGLTADRVARLHSCIRKYPPLNDLSITRHGAKPSLCNQDATISSRLGLFLHSNGEELP